MNMRKRLLVSLADIRAKAEREHPVLSGAVKVEQYRPPGHYGKHYIMPDWPIDGYSVTVNHKPEVRA